MICLTKKSKCTRDWENMEQLRLENKFAIFEELEPSTLRAIDYRVYENRRGNSFYEQSSRKNKNCSKTGMKEGEIVR